MHQRTELVDIHCHIVPGLDDGAVDLRESILMAEAAAGAGVTHMAATVHAGPGHENARADIVAAAGRLQEALAAAGSGLRVFPAAEVRLVPGLVKRIEAGEFCTVADNNRYLLLELPDHLLPDLVKQEIFDLRLHGYTPVLVHPERYPFLGGSLDYLYDWVRMGALCQLTADSITGRVGRRVQRAATRILRGRLGHIIASDAHGRWGNSDLRPAVAAAAAILEQREEAMKMVTEIPRAVIMGRPVEVDTPRPAARRRGFWPVSAGRQLSNNVARIFHQSL